MEKNSQFQTERLYDFKLLNKILSLILFDDIVCKSDF